MIIIELIYNLSILVSLSVLSGFIDVRFHRTELTGKFFQGLLFGITAIIGMLYPFVLSDGIFFDGRSIVISLCTFFFGPLSGLIASLLAIVFRIFIGGSGALMGTLVILTSFLIGYIFFRKKQNSTDSSTKSLKLYLLGLFVHVAMLLLVFTLPSESILSTFNTVGITVIGVYPLITLLIGKILSDQESHKKLFDELKKSEVKFRAVTETSPAAIFIYQDTKFVYVNEGSVKLSGFTQEELIGREFWSFVHPDYQKMIKTRGMQRQVGDKVPSRYQFQIICKSGEVKWVDFSATIIELDGKIAALGTAYDITSMVNTLENLKQQKELFQTTIYSIGDAVITTDTSGLVQQMNQIAEQMTGYSEKEAGGKPIEDIFNIVNEKTRKPVESPVKQVIAKGAIVGLANHTILITKNNKEIPIADSGAPIKTEDGKVIGVVLVFRDKSDEHEIEKRIKESEERFRTLVEHAFDGIYMMDDKRYTYVNDRFSEITGYSKNEVLSPNFDFNLLLTEESKKVVKERYLARKQGEFIPVTYSMQLLCKDGSVKEVEVSTASIGSKERVGVIGIMRDITDRKQAEIELSAAKERMQVLVEGTPHLFFYVQDKYGDIKYISPSVEKITGYSDKEWLGQKHWYMTDTPINDEVRKRTRQSLSGVINSNPIVGEIRHANGNTLILEVYEKPIYENGNVVGLQGVAHDITDQKIAEDKLKEINYRLQTAIEGANIGIWDQNFKTKEVLRLGKWGEMLGYSTTELKKDLTSWNDLIHPDDLELVKKISDDHKRGKINELKIEHRLKTADGSYKWVLNWGKIYERDDKGNPIKASGIHLDIDERKKAELAIEEAKIAAERANQLKSEFLAQISHEIRSPLNAVLNFSQLLRDEFTNKMTEDIEVSFAGIDSASKRVIRTIDLILNVSELQLGTYEASHRKVELVSMLSIIRKEYLNLARSKKLDLKFMCDVESAEIISDEYAINQVFANLVDNAIKYTKKGSVEIILSGNNDSGFIVKIKDSGVGISKEYLPEIFDAFSQEEKGYSRKFEGSGLGMALVKKYCDLIGAKISIESERNVGTTFTLQLS